jgi:putative resolvase
MLEQKSFSLKQASKMLGVSTRILQRWDNAGKIKTFRTEGNHRRIYESEILRLQKKPKTKNCVIYARVSSRKQTQDGNIERQKERLVEYAKSKGYIIKKVFCETASTRRQKLRYHFLKYLTQRRKGAKTQRIHSLIPNSEWYLDLRPRVLVA